MKRIPFLFNNFVRKDTLRNILYMRYGKACFEKLFMVNSLGILIKDNIYGSDN